MQFLKVPEKHVLQNARATYYPTPDGLRLARVQVFDTPKFRPDGWEKVNQEKPSFGEASAPDDEPLDVREEGEEGKDRLNLLRASRRARRAAYDLIMCNPELNAFATFTFSPEKVEDKSSYQECYEYLRPWLSNGVQRRDLRYLCVTEETKKGDIHFHALMNSDALDLVAARDPRGRLVKHHGDQVYNITNWRRGFSTCQIVKPRDEDFDPVEAVAKYLFKYMTKNCGAKLGGRYVLKGGDLRKPIYVYGDGVEDFCFEAPEAYTVDLPNSGKYWEYDFISETRKSVDNLGV